MAEETKPTTTTDQSAAASDCSSVIDIDREMRKALHRLYIAIDEDVARDVASKVEAAVDWRDAEIGRLAERVRVQKLRIESVLDFLVERDDEIKRLKSGKLTPEEFHELCHNLYLHGRPITEEEFDAGCKAEKFKLFHFDPAKAKPCSALEEMKRQMHEEAMMPICNNPMDGDRIVDGIR